MRSPFFSTTTWMRTGVFEVDAVVVDEALGFEAAVLPFGDSAAQALLG